ERGRGARPARPARARVRQDGADGHARPAGRQACPPRASHGERRARGQRELLKYTRLIVANLFRKKTRTALTVGSFAVALFLFGILAAVDGAFKQGVDVAGVDRLVVLNRVSIIQPLPLAYRDRLARIPGVTGVTFANWFGGVYQDERNFFPQFAIDREHYRQMYPEFVVPDDQWQAFLIDKEGAIVGEALMERFKWKIGDRIPVKGTIFPGSWEFNIRG